jgi:hypothetical protein
MNFYPRQPLVCADCSNAIEAFDRIMFLTADRHSGHPFGADGMAFLCEKWGCVGAFWAIEGAANMQREGGEQ